MIDAKPLLRALKRLHPEQGARARTNARSRVRQELRKLSRALDEVFPSLKERTRKTKPKTERGRWMSQLAKVRKLRKLGYVEMIISSSLVAELAAASIRPRFTKHFRTAKRECWWPKWAIDLAEAGVKAGELRKANRSQQYRQALMAEKIITKGATP